MSNRNVALEKEAGVAHSFNCPPPKCMAGLLLAHALVVIFFAFGILTLLVDS